ALTQTSTTISLDDAIQLYYGELRALARHLMALETNHTLHPTEFVHDVVRDLNEQGRASFNDRQHVFAYFRVAFRHMLTDHARRKSAKKRGKDWTQVSMSHVENLSSQDSAEESFEMHQAL